MVEAEYVISEVRLCLCAFVDISFYDIGLDERHPHNEHLNYYGQSILTSSFSFPNYLCDHSLLYGHLVYWPLFVPFCCFVPIHCIFKLRQEVTKHLVVHPSNLPLAQTIAINRLQGDLDMLQLHLLLLVASQKYCSFECIFDLSAI